MRRYFQRFLLLFLAVSLGLNIVAVLLAVQIFAWDGQMQTLERAQSHGMRVRWSLPGGAMIERLPSVFEVASGARPLDIHLEKTTFDENLPLLKETAQVLGGFASLREISLEDGSDQVVDTLLVHLGKQPRLTGFYSFSSQFPERSTLHLRNFPTLKNLAIVGAPISGEQLPVLPTLENCDLSHSEITPAGLQCVLANPALSVLIIQEPDAGSEALRNAYFAAEKAHPRIRFRGIE